MDVLGGRRDDYTNSNMAPGWFIDIIYTKVLGFDLMKRRKYSYRHIIGQQQPPARNRQSSRCVSYITHTARQYLIYKPQARWWWWGPGERARAHWATCNIRFLLLLHHLLTAVDDRKLYLQKTIFSSSSSSSKFKKRVAHAVWSRWWWPSETNPGAAACWDHHILVKL